MTGTTTQMYNDRNILYPSITICPAKFIDGVGGVDPDFVNSAGGCAHPPWLPPGCDFGHFGRKVNLSNIIAVLEYYKVNETG